MEDSKGKPKRSVIRWIFFVLFHLGLIGCLYGTTINAELAFAGLSFTDGLFPFLFLIALANGAHLFASLLYKEYTREQPLKLNTGVVWSNAYAPWIFKLGHESLIQSIASRYLSINGVDSHRGTL